MTWMIKIARSSMLFALTTTLACGAAKDDGISTSDPDYYSDGEGMNNGTADDWGESAADDGGVETEDPIQVDPGQLTAGRWQDLQNWDFWLKLMDPDEDRHFRDLTVGWGLHPFERITVHLANDGAPVRDQAVELTDGEARVLWKSRTDVTGTAFLFPAMLGGEAPADLEVTAGESSIVLDEGQDDVEIELGALSGPSDVLDVMFTIDVTGSMTDEQDYLRAEMRDVMQRLAADRPELNIRASFNFYCDPDDSFLVESHPFSDVPTALDVLDEGAGCGGGDFPEAVDEGLADALDHEWSQSARARILFLVLDAPPHTDQEGIDRLQAFAEQASAKGIKLVPIVSSGSDHSLEFLMRSLVIATNGTYTFLTADSGIGGAKLEPTIGSYEVEMLNELMLDLLLTESAAD